MKRDFMDDIIRTAAAVAEQNTKEYIDELDSAGETVSPELDRRVAEMIRDRRRTRRIRALTSGFAAAAAALCVAVGLSGILPQKYLIGEVAEPGWFPADVTGTVITDTAELYEAVYKTADGKTIRLIQERNDITVDSSNSTPVSPGQFESFGSESESLGPDSGNETDEDHYPGSIFSDSLESAAGDSETSWAAWSDGEYRYWISGDVSESEIRRIAESAGAE